MATVSEKGWSYVQHRYGGSASSVFSTTGRWRSLTLAGTANIAG
jgi:hypothetical protein